MKDQLKKRAVAVAALIVATSLSLFAVMEYVAGLPTLFIRSAEMNVMADGSVQMLFSVGVENMPAAMPLSNGAGIRLRYNKDYLEPSNHSDNKRVDKVESGKVPAFFSANPDLYPDDGNYPFVFEVPGLELTNILDTSTGSVSLVLLVRRGTAEEPGGILESAAAGEGEMVDYYYAFDAHEDSVSLGTLSFRVTDVSLLPKIVKEFGGTVNELDPKGASGEDRLVYFEQPVAPQTWRGDWQIGGVQKLTADEHRQTYLDNAATTAASNQAQAAFTFEFPKTLVSVELAEPEVTLNAYQAYTDGTAQDVAVALQKYSPSVIATYTDGSQKTFILNWSGCEVTAVDTNGTPIAGYDPATDYDPTGNQTYEASQILTYEELDAGGNPVQKTFPVPVKAKLTVTPVNLVSVSADDLHKTYPLNDALVSLTSGILAPGDMELPNEARLVTDVVVGGASLTMDVHGWTPNHGAWPAIAQPMSTLLSDDHPTDANYHWPTNADTGKWDTVSENRKGTYSFHMAESYGGAADTFTKAEIQDAYPWMTVEKEEYTLEDATRKLVGTNQWVDNNLYQVAYISTKNDADNGQPTLTLQVSRLQAGGGETVVHMEPGSLFRILLPDGTELGTGLENTGTVGGSVSVDNWFDAPAGSGGTDGSGTEVNEADWGYYRPQENMNVGEYTGIRGFDLVTNPGDPTQGDDGDKRELLRRYINLGGWFHVSINENTNANEWTNYIPVYVPPRENRYLEDKVYNFMGPNAGLFNWPGGLTTTVTLPKGSYWPVDELTGERREETLADGTKIPVSERYGVATIYDGATGAQPGELNTFTIEAASWDTSSSGSVTQYGPNAFKDGAVYNAYGAVYNYGYAATEGDPVVSKTATIRRDVTEAPAQVEAITLTYEQDGGGVTYGTDGNVDLVTYDTKKVGYTVRQDYVLTITNVGTVDIYGLTIDTLTDDAYRQDATSDVSTDDGGHFIVLTPPASFLPVGESTTFTLSYVYDLKPVMESGVELYYKDKLYITSNSRPTAVYDDPNTYLLDFDAQFQVTDEDIHRVTVIVDPAGDLMGTASVIIGESQQSGVTNMDTTAGSNAFIEGETVYIAAWTEDEYEVQTVTGVDSAGNTVPINPYAGAATLPDGVKVYSFTMPDYDTYVTVKFYEPIYSKLRLGQMVAYADEQEADLKPYTATPDAYTIWQKSFTQEELDDAQDWESNSRGPSGEYLMTVGTAIKAGISKIDPPDKPTVEQYIVVIPYEANYAQVEVTLRHIIYTLNGANAAITPTVSMALYPTSPVDGSVTVEQILLPETGSTAPAGSSSTAVTPSVHCSEAFLSPAPGSSKYVRVDMTYTETGTTTSVTRSYYLEIHRAPKDADATLHYGNSPFGMIMNDPAIADADKATALNDFVTNRYSFEGLALVPSVVTDENGLTGVHYWSEAWMLDVNARYEPESGYIRDSAGNSLLDENLDLNEYAFFAMQGEGFLDPGLKEAKDSTGRPVDVTTATISLKALTLDETAADQLGRFRGDSARTEVLDLGPAAATTADDWAGTARLRPGRYELIYTFKDYDGSDLTAIRPFVVLTPVGDVNGDGKRDTDAPVDRIDELLMEDRVSAPLGYQAEDYPNAAIFKYRCCDSNNDRNINNIDSNTIRTGTNLTQRFYLSTGYKPAT